MIFISSECNYLERLIDELCIQRNAYSPAGKVMVEKKKDLKKRGHESPNINDAFICACSPLEKVVVRTTAKLRGKRLQRQSLI